MSQTELAAQTRAIKGKGAARKLRREGRIPAVFYGRGIETIMLTVDYSTLERILNKAGGENVILNLEVQSETGTESRTAMLKDLQVDPIEDTYLHADFYEIFMDKEITVNVTVRLINTPIGVTDGGILQHIRRELAITCLPDRLMDALELDVSPLDIGDSLHVRDIELPEGVTTLEEGHLTVAVVAAPSVAEVEEEELEEEVEVEGEEKAEDAEDKPEATGSEES